MKADKGFRPDRRALLGGAAAAAQAADSGEATAKPFIARGFDWL